MLAGNSCLCFANIGSRTWRQLRKWAGVSRQTVATVPVTGVCRTRDRRQRQQLTGFNRLPSSSPLSTLFPWLVFLLRSVFSHFSSFSALLPHNLSTGKYYFFVSFLQFLLLCSFPCLIFVFCLFSTISTALWSLLFVCFTFCLFSTISTVLCFPLLLDLLSQQFALLSSTAGTPTAESLVMILETFYERKESQWWGVIYWKSRQVFHLRKHKWAVSTSRSQHTFAESFNDHHQHLVGAKSVTLGNL